MPLESKNERINKQGFYGSNGGDLHLEFCYSELITTAYGIQSTSASSVECSAKVKRALLGFPY